MDSAVHECIGSEAVVSGPVHNGEDGRLRLQAISHDDLEVLSALLQDAIIPGEVRTCSMIRVVAGS